MTCACLSCKAVYPSGEVLCVSSSCVLYPQPYKGIGLRVLHVVCLLPDFQQLISVSKCPFIKKKPRPNSVFSQKTFIFRTKPVQITTIKCSQLYISMASLNKSVKFWILNLLYVELDEEISW